MKCQKVSELEDSYLLGDLGKEGMEQVEHHLRECSSCSQRLSGHEELLGQVFAALEPLEPPARVRSSVLQTVAGSPPAVIQRRRWTFGLGPVYGAVAAALIVALSIWLLVLSGQLREAQARQVEAQQLLKLTSAPDSWVWTMTQPGVPFNPAAPRARMYARPDYNFYLVTVTNLQSAQQDETYRMWYVHDTQVEFGGEVRPDATGQAILKVSDPEQTAPRISSCFITLEKSNTPPSKPTSQPLVKWERA